MGDTAAGDVLDAGIRWLYDTVQPDGAIVQHHGIHLCADGDRTYVFLPVGKDDLPVIVTNVKHPVRDEARHTFKNPIGLGEMDALCRTIEARRVGVLSTWNGHPAHTGSVQLDRPAHPTLVDAVKRYLRGCPDHPEERVFCRCGWFQAGNALLVQPPAGPYPPLTLLPYPTEE